MARSAVSPLTYDQPYPRYVPLFGEDSYDPSKEREDTVSFLEQLQV
eukprot:CAMPEP_0182593514 /NCGR_PEP_ID=MMETSP1324-20130603/78153_1 /TAXON_ID=236786 /ORGANISM="Florenciella sp., Strain RCC1587" /LENGTH=45 /DNA_ID= /DNA_START= /DNA_END= /DNA_ORIENTATION=